jgi:hypothetical protein
VLTANVYLMAHVYVILDIGVSHAKRVCYHFVTLFYFEFNFYLYKAIRTVPFWVSGNTATDGVLSLCNSDSKQGTISLLLLFYSTYFCYQVTFILLLELEQMCLYQLVPKTVALKASLP